MEFPNLADLKILYIGETDPTGESTHQMVGEPKACLDNDPCPDMYAAGTKCGHICRQMLDESQHAELKPFVSNQSHLS